MADKQLTILYLYQMMLRTDAEHRLNASEIRERMLGKYGFACDRRTIYEQIERLRQFGLKIEGGRGQGSGYYLNEHDFELPELKLLVDAVQSSKFITKEQTETLVKKLEKYTNEENAKELQRHVFIQNRIKAENLAIYDNIDVIHAAMRDNLQIRFKYCKWTAEKQLVQRKHGADYIVSPWSLTWDDANYYLVAYDTGAEGIKHYRVDKMQNVSVTGLHRMGADSFQNFDLAAYMRKTFGMYGGPDRKLTLEGTNSLIGVIVDRFGLDTMIRPCGDDQFHATVTVSVSPQFFGWLAGLGNGVKISWPEDLRQEYKAYLRSIIEN